MKKLVTPAAGQLVTPHRSCCKDHQQSRLLFELQSLSPFSRSHRTLSTDSDLHEQRAWITPSKQSSAKPCHSTWSFSLSVCWQHHCKSLSLQCLYPPSVRGSHQISSSFSAGISMFQSLNFHTPIMPWRLPAIPKPCSGAGQLHSISPDFWGSKPEPSCWQLDQHCTEDCNNHPAPISCTPDTADICGLWDLFCLPSPKPLQNCFHPASSQSAPELILPQRCKEAAKCQSPHGTIMTLQLYRHIFSSVIRYR